MARWTREELLLALNLYFETPFGKQHKTYPPIVALAQHLGRTPSSVGMKLCNFTSLDPVEAERGIKGLSGASKLDRDVWNQFHENPSEVVSEIESLLESDPRSSNPSMPINESAVDSVDDSINDLLDVIPVTGTDTISLVTLRRHQNFFRRIVLRSYATRCCITGNPIPKLLRASHIIPWSQSRDQRLNPRNGLCLAATFDAAFDHGLIAIDSKYRLVLSDAVVDHRDNPEVSESFIGRNGNQIFLPEKNLPDLNFLEWHRDNVFQG